MKRAEAFLAEEELDSGIVVHRGNELRFWHLTFQEYLAAQALAGRGEKQQQALLLGPELSLYTPEWRESVLLLGGVLYLQGLYKVEGLVGAVLDRLHHSPPGSRTRPAVPACSAPWCATWRPTTTSRATRATPGSWTPPWGCSPRAQAPLGYANPEALLPDLWQDIADPRTLPPSSAKVLPLSVR